MFYLIGEDAIAESVVSQKGPMRQGLCRPGASPDDLPDHVPKVPTPVSFNAFGFPDSRGLSTVPQHPFNRLLARVRYVIMEPITRITSIFRDWGGIQFGLGGLVVVPA